MKKDILSRLWNLGGWYGLVARVQVLVLTHNFEMRKPVVTRLPFFTICGLWLQICLWQNCKSKQAVCFDSKPILLWLAIKNGTSWQAKSDTLEKNGKINFSPFALCLKTP